MKTFDVKKVILNIFILNSMIVDIEVRGGREREGERGGGGGLKRTNKRKIAH